MKDGLRIMMLVVGALALGACGGQVSVPEEAAELLEEAAPPVEATALEAAPPVEEAAPMPESTEASDAEAPAAEGHEAPHWAYEGEAGPEHWGDLDAKNAACASGTMQSPIDLTGATEADMANIAFHYEPNGARILNNGHTIEVRHDPGSTIEVEGRMYDLKQFHFHAPSEHTIDGQPAAAEVHLVHQDAGGNYAVVGVMLTEGEPNATLAPVWEQLPPAAGPETPLGFPVDAAGLLPADQRTFRYTGSLTTPPCTEGVAWFVMAQPMSLSADQIAAFKAIVDPNNRPLQALGDRELGQDSTP